MRRASWVALLALLALGLAQRSKDTKEFTDWSPAVNLGAPINTSYLDSCVAISKDRLSLFFSSNRATGILMNRDLYVSQRERVDDAWGAPVFLSVLNSDSWDSCPALSLDEHRLYFTSLRTPNCGGNDIWVSRRQDRRDDVGWEPPVNLGCEADGYVNTPGWDLAPTFFEDEAGNEVMYFATNLAGADTTQCHHYESVMRRDDTFGPAVPVYELNSGSPYGDVGITVRRDGLEVFLLSNRPYGGATAAWNFWRATRASTRDGWSDPVFVPSLGNPALAQGRIALSFDGSELYFTSTRGGGYGRQDLWVARREQLRGPGK